MTIKSYIQVCPQNRGALCQSRPGWHYNNFFFVGDRALWKEVLCALDLFFFLQTKTILSANMAQACSRLQMPRGQLHHCDAGDTSIAAIRQPAHEELIWSTGSHMTVTLASSAMWSCDWIRTGCTVGRNRRLCIRGEDGPPFYGQSRKETESTNCWNFFFF